MKRMLLLLLVTLLAWPAIPAGAEGASDGGGLPEGPSGYVRLKNKWQSNYLYEGSDGVVRYGATSADDRASHWQVETEDSYSRLKNRATGHYITVESGMERTDPLRSLPLTGSTLDDQWVIEASNRPGFYVIKNARDPAGNYVIHEENQLGYAQYSNDINVTFESPQWAFEPAEDTAPVRLANQYRAGQYLYEDAEGFVKYGPLPATDSSSHWYLDVQSEPGDGTQTVRIRNRATGHVVTQGVFFDKIKALPPGPGNPAESEWTMAPNADPSYVFFRNAAAMQQDPPLTYVLNTQFEEDTNARSNDWAQPEWGSALWRAELAPDTAPRRIYNFTPAATGSDYLYDDNGLVKVGALNAADPGRSSAYLWVSEDYDGAKRLRNLSTGRYVSERNIAVASDPLETREAPVSDGGDRWLLQPSTEYDDYVSVQSAVYSNRYIHIADSLGWAQSGEVDPDLNAAQWLFEDPEFASDGSPVYVRIQNEWQPFVLYEDANGELKYGNAAASDQRAQWEIERYEGRKRIKNRATGHYVSLGTAAPGRIGVSGGDASGLAARWIIQELGGGVKLIQNLGDRQDGSGQDKYVHLQGLNKYAEYGVINSGWGSPRWRFVIVRDAEPTTFRFKSKTTGQYLYEVYTEGDAGELKFGSVSADDLSSVWFKEDTGDGVGTYRLKNMRSGNYVSMEHFAAGGHELEDAPNVPLQTIKQIYPTWGSVKWYVEPGAEAEDVQLRSGWTGAHYVYDDGSGAVKVRKNAAGDDTAQFAAEEAELPDASLPAGEVRIRSAANGMYLYENGGGIVMYGTPEEHNGYSHWRIVVEAGDHKLVNRVTGHAIRVSSTGRMIESAERTDAGDPPYRWSVEPAPDGVSYVIRSAMPGIDDELLNVQAGAGYAERGLYPISFGSVQWTLEEAPAEFDAPSWDEGRNGNTATPIQDEANYIRILTSADSSGGLRTLYESGGRLLLGPADKSDEAAQWLLQDFNGRKLLKNRATGGYATIGAEGDGALNAQWTIEERLGYNVLRNASQGAGSLTASTAGVSHGASANANNSLWTFEPLASDVKYEAEEAFAGAGVAIGSSGTGFSGSGYAENFAQDKGRLSFAVHAQSAGTYEAVIRYRNTGGESALNIVVNGYSAEALTLPEAADWTDAVVDVALRSGMNSLALETAAPGGDGIAVDYAVVKASVNKNYRGATVPYTTYEAEHAATNGEVIGPSRTYLEIASEASGRQAVRLDETGQYVEFKLTKPANSIVLRYAMPDSADGAGIEADLALYVNGVFRQNLHLTSKHAWEYGSYPWSNDPSQGSGHRFFDEAHALIGDVPAGATIRLQKDASSAADYYVIDLADMEQADGPYAMPDNFLSIADYGAVADDGIDDTAAFLDAMAAAKTSGQGLWIPSGEFTFGDDPIELDDVTIRGAGMWHTTLLGAKFFGRGTNIRVYDLLIDGDLNVRDDEASTHAFEGAFGIGSVIEHVWVEHSKTGLWLTRPKTGTELTEGLYMMGLRLRNLMADGINFCVGTSDSMMEQTDIRYPGDDGIAMWSAEGVASVNNTARFNTVSLPWLADNIVVFGGRDNKIQDNIAKDTIVNGAGIAVSTRFNPVPFSGTTIVERNTLVRTGSYDTGYGTNLGAIWLFASDKDLNGSVIVRDNVAIDSTHSGIFVHGSFAVDNLLLQNIVVDGAGTNGIEVSSDVRGEVELDNVIVRGDRVAPVGALPGGFALTERNAGLVSLRPAFQVRLNGGSPGALRLRPDQTGTLQIRDASGANVTSSAVVRLEPSTVASLDANGRIAAAALGNALVTVQVGGVTQAYTLIVAAGSGGSGNGGYSGGGGGGSGNTAGETAANDARLTEAEAGPDKTIRFETGGGEIGTVSFSADALRTFAEAHPDAFLRIGHGGASLTFPSALIARLLEEAGADGREGVWTFSIGKPDADTLGRVGEQAGKQGIKTIGEPVDFTIGLYRDGKPVKVFKHFGGTFVERTIELAEAADQSLAAAFRYDPDTGELRYVPVRFETEDGKTIAVIRSMSNSVYVVASLAGQRAFRDVRGHWAEREIERLSARTILNGVSADEFAPGRTVTRAEFAAMLARALGLGGSGAEAGFADVRSGDWFAEAVSAAAQIGIVEGGTDGRFRPGATITREQMAVMAARALGLTGVSSGEASGAAANLKDLNTLKAWSVEPVRLVLEAGIMRGNPSGLFAPEDAATRAEAAVIIVRLLEAMKLI
ncbi:S-layer homology domain-containing protein [Cohnella cellulosilytica]